MPAHLRGGCQLNTIASCTNGLQADFFVIIHDDMSQSMRRVFSRHVQLREADQRMDLTGARSSGPSQESGMHRLQSSVSVPDISGQHWLCLMSAASICRSFCDSRDKSYRTSFVPSATQ